tara:strand:- start:633 stop:1124 length:492 start_codon:yes stop_codon:yes gene_type:complete
LFEYFISHKNYSQKYLTTGATAPPFGEIDMTKSFKYNDGGRSQYFKGKNAGDCVVRAIAIALELDYKTCYDELASLNKETEGKKTARGGTHKANYEKFLKRHGWVWHSAPKLEGRKARYYDMPNGRIIMRMARHLSALVEQEIHDTWDCSYKMVYGYYAKPTS